MPVHHTPQKTPDKSDTYAWKVSINGKQETVLVNKNQNEYLTLPGTTTEQKTQFLTRIVEDQMRQEAAAATEAAAAVAATTATTAIKTPANSPTPTEKSIEEILERTRKSEESIRKNTGQETG